MPSDQRISYRWITGVATLYGLAILAYSQTLAFSWDAGYHLLAAQLIAGGRRPYIDFCFPQAPLNAYWNAALDACAGRELADSARHGGTA